MALKVKRIETNYGAVFEDVYFKLSMIRYVDSTNILTFNGVFYLNEEIRFEDELKYIDNMNFVGYYTLEDKTVNMFENTYNFIKEYAEMVNIQENVQLLNKEELGEKLDTRYLIFVDSEDC